MRSKPIITGILLSILFFFIGIWTTDYFLIVTRPPSKYVIFVYLGKAISKDGQLYCVLLSLIPITLALLWRFAPIVAKKWRMFSVIIVLSFIFLAGYARYLMMMPISKKYADEWRQAGHQVKGGFPIPFYPKQWVNIPLYMFGGFVIGVLVSYLVCRERKNKKAIFDFEN